MAVAGFLAAGGIMTGLAIEQMPPEYTARIFHVSPQYGMRLGAEYFAFNAVCELDRPGEWALDSVARRLYVWPRSGADMPRLARTKTLLGCRGVTDVTFEGFVFEAARGHAVVFADCRDVALEKSVVRHTTGWGVCVERGRGCRVEGCDLYDLGECGVWLEGGSIDTLSPSRHVCDNCLLGIRARNACCGTGALTCRTAS